MARRYSDRIAFIGMPGRDDVGPMRAFVARYELGFFPHAIDPDGSLWNRLGVSAQPAWIFVDDTGAVQRRFGAIDEPELEGILDRLVAS